MTVTVLIRRSAKNERDNSLLSLLISLRAKAVEQPGYISGETLFSLTDRGSTVVLSRWQSRNDWKTWESSAARRKLVESIDRLLESPPAVEVFVGLPSSAPGADG